MASAMKLDIAHDAARFHEKFMWVAPSEYEEVSTCKHACYTRTHGQHLTRQADPRKRAAIAQPGRKAPKLYHDTHPQSQDAPFDAAVTDAAALEVRVAAEPSIVECKLIACRSRDSERSSRANPI